MPTCSSPRAISRARERSEQIEINGQISRAADYGRIVLRAYNGAVLRLSDVAHVIDGVANTRLAAWQGRTPAIILSVSKIAGANVIQTVDRVKKDPAAADALDFA